MEKSKRLIFVGGAPRSGTTLVQNVLDSHPLILGGPEFLHLPDLVELRRKLKSSVACGYINILCAEQEVDAHLAGFVEDIFLRLADKSSSRLYSEKTPANILVFQDLMELFPEAHFIHVIRDPRAIVSSMQQVKNRALAKGMAPPDFTAQLSASISYVQRCLDAGFAAHRKSRSRVLNIVYEELLKNSVEQTEKICAFLGVEWSELMLSPGESTHLGEQAITVKSGEIWYDKDSYNRNIDPSSMEKWQTELTLRQQLRTMLAFEGNRDLAACGYDFSLESLSQVDTRWMRWYCQGLCLLEKISTASLAKLRKIPGLGMIKRTFL
ncbi:sulfotransferase family protein [Desulfogranum mediterraneum]|uniref:sulfotransferase family protein n=1 Tax=Desulfogranum mediterraneum TaxID=160661 RepID=UPI00048AC2A3|nr:sulfotransferase [Desulfogranum mediterraneum]